ncbi:MAG: ornithine carbamoyltransferase [Verrucomicrobiota bacterium]
MNWNDEVFRGRSLLTLNDLSDEEMLVLVDLAGRLKDGKRTNRAGMVQHLKRRAVVLVFEKPSTRTRCAGMVAASDEGASVAYLGKGEIHLGKKESVADTARVLGRMFDGIMFRGFAHDTVTALAKHSGVPVMNGLTDEAHPTQVLADLLTIRESFGRLAGLRLAYLGDGRNNVCNSLMLGCAKAGVNFVNCCPPSLVPDEGWLRMARAAAERNGSTVEVVHEPAAGVKGANVLYTDVWTSMGEESQFNERVELLRPYQVNAELVAAAGTAETNELIFLHCLPAYHDRNTELTREIGALEVTDEVFEADYSRVFDEAENRMHTIKAVMVATMAD